MSLAIADNPAVLRFQPPQPMPKLCLVARYPAPMPVTAITRIWDNGDESRCRLCPSCGAAGGVCMVIVPRVVDNADIALVSVREGGGR